MSPEQSSNGIKVLAAAGGVDETLNALERLAQQKGMTIFARINFA